MFILLSFHTFHFSETMFLLLLLLLLLLNFGIEGEGRSFTLNITMVLILACISPNISQEAKWEEKT
jgi:hypothetical protein